MTFWDCRAFASLLTAMFILSGCGESQIQSSGLAALSAGSKSLLSRHGGSWMMKRATSEDLIYATNGCGGTCVISYPSGQLVGSLGVGEGFSTGDCVDDSGNVYIADGTSVVEYAHGGTTPVNTFYLPGSGFGAKGCSVDLTTGSLAVVFSSSEADVAVFLPGQVIPKTYASVVSAAACGYDNQGNLFVSGLDGQSYALAELPSGGTEFSVIQVSSKVGRPGRVQWDGQYLTYQGTTKGKATISQLSISGSKATLVKQIRLSGISGTSYLSWISNGVVFVPFSQRGLHAKKIGAWSYPSGGKPTQTFTRLVKPQPNVQSVTLSLSNQ